MKRAGTYLTIALLAWALCFSQAADAATNVLTYLGYGSPPHSLQWESAVTMSSGDSRWETLHHKASQGTTYADWTIVLPGAPLWGPGTYQCGYTCVYQLTGVWENWSNATGKTGILPPFTDWQAESNHISKSVP